MSSMGHSVSSITSVLGAVEEARLVELCVVLEDDVVCGALVVDSEEEDKDEDDIEDEATEEVDVEGLVDALVDELLDGGIVVVADNELCIR
jgi:hypothetical protein